MSYTSSIVSKFGDTENVKKDAETIAEILGRQGASLLVDVLAEQTAKALWSFDLDESERQRAVDSLVSELKNALNERS